MKDKITGTKYDLKTLCGVSAFEKDAIVRNGAMKIGARVRSHGRERPPRSKEEAMRKPSAVSHAYVPGK